MLVTFPLLLSSLPVTALPSSHRPNLPKIDIEAFVRMAPDRDYNRDVLEPFHIVQANKAAEDAARTAREAARLAEEARLRSEADERTRTSQIVSQPLTIPSGSDSLSQWLYKLRTCESGGRYNINTGNGYYGAYQFSIPTWNHWNTGYARADLAPPEVQDDTIIKNTLAASGGLATQNPGCYKSQGLSAFPPD